MASLNQVNLIGRLGSDPEVRYMPNGKAVCNFSLATSESWKDQQGQKQERTEWHRIVMFDKVAEIAGEYLKKGALVYLAGRLQTRKWQDQGGQDRYTTEIVCDKLQMLGSRQDGAGGQQQGGAQAGGGQQQPPRAPAQQAPQSAPASGEPPQQDWDDDIPF